MPKEQIWLKDLHGENKYMSPQKNTQTLFDIPEHYLQLIETFKNPATIQLTVDNYSFKNMIGYFTPYLRIKMGRSIEIRQPKPRATFKAIWIVLLIVNYFNMPDNFVLSAVRKKRP